MNFVEKGRVVHRRNRLRPIDYVAMAVAAWSSPLATWANNPVGVGHPERLILLGAVPWLVGVMAVHLSVAYGARRATAVGTAFAAILALMRGAVLFRVFGIPGGFIVAGTAVAIVAYLISKREDQSLVPSVLVAVSLVLMGGVAGSLYEERSSLGIDRSLANGGPLGIELTNTPDVFLVLTDGYAGRVTMAEDFGEVDPPVLESLEAAGFEVPLSAWAAFPSTETSFPSLLDMAYPMGTGPWVDAATQEALYETIGGDNRFVAELSQHGYRVVMVESGWSGSHCGTQIDTCIQSHFLDEAVFWTVTRSLLRPFVLDSLGYAFTVGAHSTMDWLLENAMDIAANGVPDLVLAHLTVPHPPLFLDSDCRHSYASELSGVTLVRGGDDVDQRKSAYLQQAACVDGFFDDLTDIIDGEAVIVYVADHGTDLRDLDAQNTSRSEAERVRERLNIFMAVRNRDGCSIGDPVLLPNLLRRVLSCLARSPIEDLDPRMFKTAVGSEGGRPLIVEVEPELVKRLMANGVADPPVTNASG